jgi:UDP-3-O-[3-hydroxymyristoyl] glucosamine N-acyltransferase
MNKDMDRDKTVKELAHWLDVSVEGNLETVIHDVASLDAATESDVSFLDSERHLASALSSRAGCLLVPEKMAPIPGRTVLKVRNPRYAMARMIGLFHPPMEPTRTIHPTALIGKNTEIVDDVCIDVNVVIGDGVKIGRGSCVEANCVLGDGVILGEQCHLDPRVTIYAHTRIGNRVVFHSGCVIGSPGFGYVFERGRYHAFPQIGTVEIGDDVEIGSNTTVDRGALGPTRIGTGTKIDNLVQVGHNVEIGEHCVIAAQTGISGSAVIEDYVTMAGQVGVGDQARIQKGAIIGGQAGVLPHKVARAGQPLWGTPARPLKEFLKQQAVLIRMPKILREKKSREEEKSAKTDPAPRGKKDRLE